MRLTDVYIISFACLMLGIMIGGVLSWVRQLSDIRHWKAHIRMLEGMYDKERDFFKQAMELAGKYRERSDEIRKLLIERLTPDEIAEVQKQTEIAELELLFRQHEGIK
jgi:hypothetical protein